MSSNGPAVLTDFVGPLRQMWEATVRPKPDKNELRQTVAFVAAGPLNPSVALSLVDTPAGREMARAWFEAVDDLLLSWIKNDPRAARAILVPYERGFDFGVLFLLPMYLRTAGSERVENQRAWPSKLPPIVLLRAMLHSDAYTPLDYGAVMEAIEPWTRRAFVTWFLGCYLTSPLEFLDPAVIDNRARAIDGFVAYHGVNKVNLPHMLALASSAFVAPALTVDATAFLATLSDAVLEPAFACPGQPEFPSTGGKGIVLTHWGPDTAVHRCMAPLVQTLQNDERFVLDPHSAWEGSVHEVATAEAIEACARRIASSRLDFLFYPEVGLTQASRWLATRRLARVQATGYGHPVTTGSSVMDYFVAGAAVETDGSTYRERLILLPGIGLTSTEPPAPSGPRARPVDGEDILFVSLASYNKLTPDLCGAWERILARVPKSRLELVASVPDRQLARATRALSGIFIEGEVTLTPRLQRQECVDLVAEADVYLDSFPFGGYNTLVEALASGCPVITLEGRHAYGRYGAALLRELTLPDWMITTTIEEYVAAAIKLATDVPLRLEIRDRLSRRWVVDRLCRESMSAHFDAAVEWMRREGPSRGAPVYIEAGERPRMLTG